MAKESLIGIILSVKLELRGDKLLLKVATSNSKGRLVPFSGG